MCDVDPQRKDKKETQADDRCNPVMSASFRIYIKTMKHLILLLLHVFRRVRQSLSDTSGFSRLCELQNILNLWY